MRLINKITQLSLCISLLAACANAPEHSNSARQLQLSDFSVSFKVDAQAEKIIQEWPKSQWWLMFHNSELQRLIETALMDNPGLHAATARLTQAEATSDGAVAQMLPSLDSHIDMHVRRFSGTDFYGPNGGKTFTGAYIDPAVFRYHLDIWGKDRAALAAALGEERAQASELAMAQLLLSTAITRNYFKLCATVEEIELAQALSQKAQQLTSLAQLRWERGLTGREAVFASEQQAAAARQRETGLRQQEQLLRNQLATLVGKGPDWGVNIQSAHHQASAYLPEPAELALGLLAHRPDVAAALWRVKAAAQTVKIAETNFYPDVNLVGFAGLRSLRLKDLFLSHGASVAYGLGPTVTLPIFEGGRLEAELKNTQATYNAAVESYNATLLSAVQQVADHLAEWRQTQSDDSDQELALAAANSGFLLADKRFQAGISNRDVLIEAEANLLRQQMTASRMHNEHLLAAVGLIEALGGGYQQTNITEHLLRD